MNQSQQRTIPRQKQALLDTRALIDAIKAHHDTVETNGVLILQSSRTPVTLSVHSKDGQGEVWMHNASDNLEMQVTVTAHYWFEAIKSNAF
jgi:hypothetical protein